MVIDHHRCCFIKTILTLVEANKQSRTLTHRVGRPHACDPTYLKHSRYVVESDLNTCTYVADVLMDGGLKEVALEPSLLA